MKTVAIGVAFGGIFLLLASNLRLFLRVLLRPFKSFQEEEWFIKRAYQRQGVFLGSLISLIIASLVVKIVTKG